MKHFISALAISLCSSTYGVIFLDFVYDPATDATTATYNGSWDTFAESPYGGTLGGLDRAGESFYAIGSAASFDPLPTTMSISTPWETNDTVTGSSGDPFGFDTDQIYGPRDFTSGQTISGSLVFGGQDLTDLGFDADEIANGGFIPLGGTNVVSWSASAIPELSSFTIAWVATLSVMMVRRRSNTTVFQPAPGKHYFRNRR